MSSLNQTTLADILRGVTAGRVQSVGIMQVIPLVSDLVDERFAPPHAEISTTRYGTLVFKNPTPQPMIMPKDSTYIVKQAAQDHALPHVGLVPARGNRTYDTAACVQPTQGGTISAGQYTLMILPFPLRESAFLLRKNEHYSKLWETIGRMNTSMGVSSGNSVAAFLERYKGELAQFVAEFESVPNQVGAIVLINGTVVGIERTPNYEYWDALWTTLIRDCYGSLALHLLRQGEKPKPTRSRVILEGNYANLEALYQALRQTNDAENEAVRAIIRELVNEPINSEGEEIDQGLVVESLSSPHFVGQTVRDGLAVVYASLTATSKRVAAREQLSVGAFAV